MLLFLYPTLTDIVYGGALLSISFFYNKPCYRGIDIIC